MAFYMKFSIYTIIWALPRELFQHAEKREIPENAGRIGPFDIAAFVVKLFRSGRRKGNECKDARKQFDSLLADEIRKW